MRRETSAHKISEQLKDLGGTILDPRSLIPHTTLTAARAAVKRLLGNVKPTPPPGREDRLRATVARHVDSSPIVRTLPFPGEVSVRLELRETFGKPLLVSLDLVITADAEPYLALEEAEREAIQGLFTDVLDRAVEAAWDNPEVAPVAIRARIVGLSSAPVRTDDPSLRPSRHPDEVVLVDMTALGFKDEIARVEDLYARFGSPAADPAWRP